MSDQPEGLGERLAEWVSKAEQDYRALARLTPDDTPDVVSFLCQQCAEKYLKALIVASGAHPSRTHDLRELVGALPVASALDEEVSAAVRFLHPFPVAIRYPGAHVDEEDAAHAVEAARLVRDSARQMLGLDDDEGNENNDV